MADGIDVMSKADYQEVAELWTEVGMWPHVAEDEDWFAGMLARNPDCALVWREGGGVIGTVVGAWDGLRGWIYRLAVTESERGRGIGGALLEAAESRLQAMGVKQINLMVYEQNGKAEAFYARSRYERSSVKVLRKRFS